MPVSAQIVAVMEAQAEDLVRVEHLFGPGLVRAQAESNLTAVEGLLRTAPERFRAELHVLAGRTAELAGWIAQDSGDIANAEQLTSRAADHLLDSEPAIRAMVLMRRSNVLLQVDPERAEGLIAAAERLISGRPVGLLEASIARQRALVAAAKRDRNAFVGFASRALELAGADQADGDLAVYATSPYVSAELARGFMRLGQYEQALELLAAHVDDWSGEQHRDYGVAVARLLHVYVALGDYDSACDQVNAAFGAYHAAPSARTQQEIAQCRKLIRSRVRSGNVQSLVVLRRKIAAAEQGDRH
jgi:tetratricopeptide (TPR) repeat protein